MYDVQVREPRKDGMAIITKVREWKNLFPSYNQIELAESKGKQLISEGKHKAEDVRIVTTVATFQSTIQVKMVLDIDEHDDEDPEEEPGE